MTQPQIEATIELILLSTYVDSHISLVEEAAMVQGIQSLGWDSETPRDIFLLTAMSRVRKVAEDDAKVAAYVTEHAQVFPDADSQTDCIDHLRQVLAADGMVAAENRFVARVVSSFGKAKA
jgi:hypothetical protein